MESHRLKNIAIVILLLLNACLLLLLGYQTVQEGQAERETARQLRSLCAASQLTLDERLELFQQPLSPLALSRRAETEQAIASALLGGDAAASSQGGGIYSYETGCGSIQFRSGGSFYGSRLTVPAEDPQDFARSFCGRFNYEEPRFQLEDGSGTVTAGQKVGGVEVDGSGIVLTFSDYTLTAVTGSHVSLDAASAEGGAQMTCVTALARFLDYRNASGAVCSEVRRVSCVYRLLSTPNPRLTPVWQIETDTNTYYVDCETGETAGK